MEDKCPFCGAIQDTDPCNRYIFTCRTEVSGHTNSLYLRSHICYEAELAQVKAELEGIRDQFNWQSEQNAQALYERDEELAQVKAQLAEKEERLREAERLAYLIKNYPIKHHGELVYTIEEMQVLAQAFLAPPQGSTKATLGEKP